MKFEPNSRERALIEAARVAAELARVEGNYAPDELVERMALEDQRPHVEVPINVAKGAVATVCEALRKFLRRFP